jgi:hypothetical protein
MGFGAQPGLDALLTTPSLPAADLVRGVIDSLIYLPPQRVISPTVQTTPIEIPSTAGTDLANAIYTHRNSHTLEFEELEGVMQTLFPELGRILTRPTGPNLVTLTLQDRFSGQNIPLDASGTGVGQVLHLVASVLFHPLGRIFLVDEPHVYLHPGVERLLVRFLRQHGEHSYVCATHSPVFINAADPERYWLVSRDEGGSKIRSVFDERLSRKHILGELGVKPADVALAERVLFVEGDSDKAIYPILLAKLGWDLTRMNCSVVELRGSGTSSPLASVVGELSQLLDIDFTICLDGDKKREYRRTSNVRYLAVAELENLFLQDAAAVRQGLHDVLAQHAPRKAKTVAKTWTTGRVQEFTEGATAKDPHVKGSKVLIDLAYAMGTTYDKRVHGEAIASLLSETATAVLRPTLDDFFSKSDSE